MEVGIRQWGSHMGGSLINLGGKTSQKGGEEVFFPRRVFGIKGSKISHRWVKK